MITIKHARATFKVKPENAPAIHDLLTLIDKSKGKRGPKLTKQKTDSKHSAVRRDYPVFNPRTMLTSDYVTACAALNSRLMLKGCAFKPAVNRTPPNYDPHFPVCVEEPLE